MDTALYSVIFDGQVQPDTDPHEVRQRLAALLMAEPEDIAALFSGAAIALKRNLPRPEAEQYLHHIKQAGAQARLEPEGTTSAGATEMPPVFSPYAPPKAGVDMTQRAPLPLKILSLDGRIGRIRYLAWSWALAIGALIGFMIIAALLPSSLAGGLAVLAVIAYSIVVTIFGIRRLHDMDWSGWLMLLNFIPGVSMIFMLLIVFIPGTAGPNRFGAPCVPNSRGVWLVFWLSLALMVLIAMGAFALGVIGALAKH